MFQPEALMGPRPVFENATQSLVAETDAIFDFSGLLIPRIYGGLWFFAWLVGLYISKRYVDNRNCSRWGVIVQQDNPPTGKFGYIITVVSGHLIGGRTTSHVGIRLHGENYSSLARLLSYSHRYLDQRDDWFLIICSEPLGPLTKLEIWHDCSGAKPYMYLRNVVVRDLENGRRWLFPAYQWLSLDHGTRRAYAVLTPARRTKHNLFFDRLADGLQNNSTWISLCYMHPRSTYTSSQRFTVAMTSHFVVLTLTTSPLFYNGLRLESNDAGDLPIVININVLHSLWLSVIAVLVSFLLSQLFRVSRKDEILLDHRSQEDLEEAALSTRYLRWFGMRKGQCSTSSERKRRDDAYLKEFETTGVKKKGKDSVPNPAVGSRVERLLHMIDAAKNVRLANVFARTHARDKTAKKASRIGRKAANEAQDLESQTASTTGSGSVSHSAADSVGDSRVASGTASGAVSQTVSTPDTHCGPANKPAKEAAFLLSNAYIELVQRDIKRLITSNDDPEDLVMYPNAGYMLKDSSLQVVIRTQTGKRRGAVVTVRRPANLFSRENEKRNQGVYVGQRSLDHLEPESESRGATRDKEIFLIGTHAHIMSVMMRLYDQYISRTPPKQADLWPEARVALAWLICLVLIGIAIYQVIFSSLQGNWIVALAFVTHNLLNWLVAALIVSPSYETSCAFVMGYLLQKPSPFDNKRGRGLAPVRFPRMWKSLRREPRGATETMYRPLNKQESAILLVIRRHRIVFVGMLYDASLWTLWLILLLFVILTSSKENFYFFTTHMNEMFLTADETRSQEARNITDYRLHTDLIEYMKTTLTLSSITYPDPFDLQGTAVNLMLDQQNYMIGIATIRQIRVVPADLEFCDSPLKLRPPDCYRRYELYYVDSGDYGKEWGPYTPPAVTEWDKIWTYMTYAEKRAFYTADRSMYFYPGGGYVVFLSDNYDGNVQKIDMVQESSWLDYRTRLLVFGMTLYSPAYESFVDLRVCIGKSRLGAFHNFLQADVVRPTTIYSVQDVLSVMSIWVTICLGLIMLYRYFFVPEHNSVNIIAIQILNYSIVFLSLLATLNLLVTGAVFELYLYESNFSDPLFHQGFSSIGWLSSAQSAILAMLLMASTIRCAYAFKHFALFKVVMKTLRFALRPVLGMFLLLFITLIQFGISLAMLMGHASADFHSPSTSVWWLVAFIVDSNNNYEDFYEFHFYYAVPVQIVRWVMILFIYFFFVNFMLAILTTMFHLALQAVLEKERTEMTVSAFMRGKFRRFLHINRVTLHEEARQIALNKLTKMIVRERSVAARFPGIDTLPVSLSGLQAIDTIVDRFGNHHARRPQHHLDHVMATIIRNKVVADQPTSADDTVKLMRVFSVDGPKLVSAGRLALIARRLNIRQAEPIPHLTEIRSELTTEVVDSIRSLVLDDCEEVTVQSKGAQDEDDGRGLSGTSGIRESAYFSAFSSYFPSIKVRLKGNQQNVGGEHGATDCDIVPRAELVLSPKLLHLHLNNEDRKKSLCSELERLIVEPNRTSRRCAPRAIVARACDAPSLAITEFQSLEPKVKASKGTEEPVFRPRFKVD